MYYQLKSKRFGHRGPGFFEQCYHAIHRDGEETQAQLLRPCFTPLASRPLAQTGPWGHLCAYTPTPSTPYLFMDHRMSDPTRSGVDRHIPRRRQRLAAAYARNPARPDASGFPRLGCTDRPRHPAVRPIQRRARPWPRWESYYALGFWQTLNGRVRTVPVWVVAPDPPPCRSRPEANSRSKSGTGRSTALMRTLPPEAYGADCRGKGAIPW